MKEFRIKLIILVIVSMFLLISCKTIQRHPLVVDLSNTGLPTTSINDKVVFYETGEFPVEADEAIVKLREGGK
jgi:hypothetical protein